MTRGTGRATARAAKAKPARAAKAKPARAAQAKPAQAAKAKAKAKAKPAQAAKAKAATKPARAAKPTRAPEPSPARRARRPTAPLPPPARLAEKRYKLGAADIRPIAEGHGACIASDKITVDGHPVRFMYREAAVHEVDSGWRFLSGLESEAYMHDPASHAFYDCNTIANYDGSIVPYLAAPIGSVFERPPGAAGFSPVTDWTPPRDEPPR